MPELLICDGVPQKTTGACNTRTWKPVDHRATFLHECARFDDCAQWEQCRVLEREAAPGMVWVRFKIDPRHANPEGDVQVGRKFVRPRKATIKKPDTPFDELQHKNHTRHRRKRKAAAAGQTNENDAPRLTQCSCHKSAQQNKPNKKQRDAVFKKKIETEASLLRESQEREAWVSQFRHPTVSITSMVAIKKDMFMERRLDAAKRTLKRGLFKHSLGKKPAKCAQRHSGTH